MNREREKEREVGRGKVPRGMGFETPARNRLKNPPTPKRSGHRHKGEGGGPERNRLDHTQREALELGETLASAWVLGRGGACHLTLREPKK